MDFNLYDPRKLHTPKAKDEHNEPIPTMHINKNSRKEAKKQKETRKGCSHRIILHNADLLKRIHVHGSSTKCDTDAAFVKPIHWKRKASLAIWRRASKLANRYFRLWSRNLEKNLQFGIYEYKQRRRWLSGRIVQKRKLVIQPLPETKRKAIRYIDFRIFDAWTELLFLAMQLKPNK